MQSVEQITRAGPSERSRQSFHGGPLRWVWFLEVGSTIISSENTDCSSFTVTYDDEGASSAEVEVYANLSGHDGMPVRVYGGYGVGGAVEVFTGEMGRVAYSPTTGITKATARGPTGVLAARYYDQTVRFQGASLRSFFADLASRLYDPRTRVEVVGGDEFEIEDTVFGGEVALGESATSVLDGSGYGMSDRIGYLLHVGPRPRPATNTVPRSVYGPADFPPDQPVMEPSEEGPFSKVVVFRTDDDGQEVVRAEAPIAHRGLVVPPPNAIYWITEFQGDQVLAQNTASNTAIAIEDEPQKGTLEGVAADPTVTRHTNIWLNIDEDEPGQLDRVYRRGYSAIITEMSLDMKAATQDLTFESLRVTSEDITPPIELPSMSPYAVMSEGAVVAWAGEDIIGMYIDLEAEGDWFGEGFEGLWVDPELAADEDPVPAGEDDQGVWIDIPEEAE